MFDELAVRKEMTATGVMRYQVSVLLALCLAIVFLAACNSSQPNPGTTNRPTSEPSSAITAQPTSEPSSAITARPTSEPSSAITAQPSSEPTSVPTDDHSSDLVHDQGLGWDAAEGHLPPNSSVAPSLEEQIFSALDSDSISIVRATLSSITATVETVSGPPTLHWPIHELRFTVHEYLEGSGPNEIVVVVRNHFNYTDRDRAIGYAKYTESKRNNAWDNGQAVLFVDLSDTPSGASGASGSSSTGTAEFITSNTLESPWNYTIEHLSRVWLPAQGSSGGATGQAVAAPEFITDGAKTPSPTITLAALKSQIAALKAELVAGEGTAGFKNCIRARILRERIGRAEGVGPLSRVKTLTSGLPAGTEVYRFDHHFKEAQYDQYWLRGADEGLFEAVIIDNDESSWSGYYAGLSTARPLPGGSYRVDYLVQHYTHIPCNFKPTDAYLAWTVTVTAPAGTVHEAFFDPVAIGSGVGADASNGVLEPTAFTVGSTNTSLQSLKWESGSATLTLGASVSLSGHTLDFIALDGTVALTLDGGAAAISGNTLTWSVATQPWQADDKLMLRIGQAGALTPAPTATSGR